MSYPYPQDRHRDRKEKGEQPYKDAEEAMSLEEADVPTPAERYSEEDTNVRPPMSEDEREASAAARLKVVQGEVVEERAAREEQRG